MVEHNKLVLLLHLTRGLQVDFEQVRVALLQALLATVPAAPTLFRHRWFGGNNLQFSIGCGGGKLTEVLRVTLRAGGFNREHFKTVGLVWVMSHLVAVALGETLVLGQYTVLQAGTN